MPAFIANAETLDLVWGVSRLRVDVLALADAYHIAWLIGLWRSLLCRKFSCLSRFLDAIDEVRLIRWQRLGLDQPDQSKPLLPPLRGAAVVAALETDGQSFYTGACLQGCAAAAPSKV